MTIAIIASVLAGMAAGFRFKVFGLVPAILTVTVVTAAISFTHGNTVGTVVSATFINGIAVQIGYLCASFAFALKEAPAARTATVAESAAYKRSAAVTVTVSNR